MSGKMYEKRPEEDARYHDTWRLLKKYRDVTWSLELSIRQVKNQFRIDYDCSIEDFLESIYMAGADLGGTDIFRQGNLRHRRVYVPQGTDGGA